MAFPGTYNIDYYKGDTFEFRIYPKDSEGNPFQFDSYTQFRFTISNVRGEPAGITKQTINGYATNINNQYVLCVITPENGAELDAATTYYYDVEIGKISSPYDIIYTLLRGTITVSDQVTLPSAIPNSPQNVSVVFSSATSGTVAWLPPSGTAPISYYNVYLVSPIQAKLNASAIPSSTNNFTATIPPELAAVLPPGSPIIIGVTAENISGKSASATWSGNIPVGS